MTPTLIALWLISNYLVGSVNSAGNLRDTSWAPLSLLLGLIIIGVSASIYKQQSRPRSLAIRIHRLADCLDETTRQFRTKNLSRILRFGLILVLLVFITEPISASLAQPIKAAAQLNESPNPSRPTRVDVNFFIDDISDIDLNAGNYKITGQMIQEWKDPRLAFTPDPKFPNRTQDFNAEAAKELLKKIWEPVFEISNEDGERKTGVFSINIWPDGRIRTYEKFDSIASFNGDLHMYPYGAVNLDLVVTGFLQNRNEMIYRLRRFEFQKRNKPNEFIHGYWKFVKMNAQERAVNRSDDRSINYSQIHFQVKLEHESFQSGTLLIFIPLLAVFLTSSALLWIDPGVTASYSSPRLGGTVTLILTTIALKFSLSKQLPSVEYLTLADLLVMVTIGMLVVSLLSSCFYIWLYAEKSRELATRFNKAARIIYPILFVSVTAVFVVVHNLLPIAT